MNEIYMPFQPTLTEAGLQHFRLGLFEVPACEAFSGIVHSYLQINATLPTPYPIMPDGSQAIFIGPNGVFIGGAQTHLSNVQILQAGEYFGIRFYPGALRYFFDLDMAEITDQFVDGHFLPCRQFAELHTSIYRQQRVTERARVCEDWLLKHFRPQLATSFDLALFLIYQSLGKIRVGQLATMIGWSSRHLNRIFKLHTGLSTKTFTQIIRIQNVCRQLYTEPGNALPIALELGFVDQSHLTKDFNKYLLTSPGLFFNHLMSDFYNH